MTATTFPFAARSRAATLRDRWLRLLRDLYALPDVSSGMDDLLPDTALTRLVLVNGGTAAPQRYARPHRRRRTLRLVVEAQREPKRRAPTQGDGDDIESPHAPPPAGDPTAPASDPGLDPRSEPRSPADSGPGARQAIPSPAREDDLH